MDKLLHFSKYQFPYLYDSNGSSIDCMDSLHRLNYLFIETVCCVLSIAATQRFVLPDCDIILGGSKNFRRWDL